MSEVVDSLVSSSNIIKSESPAISTGDAIDSIHPSTDGQVPVIADFLELSAFYSDNATEFNPQITYDIRSKISEISRFIGEQFDSVPNEDEVRAYLADIITENGLDKLSPSDKLEQIYNHIDLTKRMAEIKKIKDRMRGLNA